MWTAAHLTHFTLFEYIQQKYADFFLPDLVPLKIQILTVHGTQK